jgi:PAS domain S-box-containing protein
MKTPRIHRAIFQSRMGKRIFGMFVCCSFLPIITLSTLSFFQVNRQLRDQTISRLRQMTKAIGMSIYDRLELADSELRLTAHALQEKPSGAPAALKDIINHRTSSRFQSLALVVSDGQIVPLQGELEDLPILMRPLKSEPSSGQSVIRTLIREGRPARVFISLQTAIDHEMSGLLTGEIDTAYLWGIGQQYNLPPLTQLTIMNQSGDVLISSIPASADRIRRATLSQRSTSSHHFTWHYDRQDYLGCYWDLFLKSRFEAGNWIITLSQSREDALSPLRNFKFNFPLSLLVGFWVIMLVSIRFIRKSLVPLEKLQEGTRRIQGGDFNGTVMLQSGDEFEDLAASFNLMTHRLARTFGELSVLAEMGQLVTTRPEVIALAMSELRIMADKLHFDWGLLMIQGGFLSGQDVITGFGLAANRQESGREVVSLGDDPRLSALLRHVSAHRATLFSNDIQELSAHLPPACMAFLEQIACRSLICVPMTFETHYMGVLAVGKIQAGQPLTASDQDLMTGIAAQTAMALNNIVAYHKLEESEARFRQAFDHAATGILLVDPVQRINASNHHLQQLLGYTERELLDRPLGDILSPSDHKELRETFAAMMADETPAVQVEKAFTHKNGQAIPTRLSGSLMRNALGQPIHFILHIQDLSAEKAAEQSKQQLEGQLRQAQKMEAIGTLAGGIAHDFNNILSAVSGYTELALMQLPTDSEIHGQLRNVKQAAERATDLVRQILTFSRQSEQEKKPIQIGSVVKEALKLLRASLPATIEIRQAINNEPLFVLADPTQVHQVLMNLCTNALHAMEEEGGVLEVRLERPPDGGENATFDNPSGLNNMLKLTVSDTGCGMDALTRERIFDPYFTTKGKGKGTGLGLSLVHGIVKNHGGMMNVHSVLGQGTTFDVYFPILEGQAFCDTSLPEDLPCGSESVLFIDDEAMLVSLGESMLASLGYHVVGMSDPRKAMEVFRQSPRQFDIVITDLTMPGINGERLAEKLAAIKPGIPILLCSGYVNHPRVPHLISGYIRKPVTLAKLARAVRQALDHPTR